ncbi:hypothetical protein IAU60_004070 [Kwoniella sp. DSM 27419]
MGDNSNSPPSFDAIFSSQEPPRRSSTSSSFNAYTYNPSPRTHDPNQLHLNRDSPLVDEPQSLNRKASNASMRSMDQQYGHGGRQGSSSSSGISDAMQPPKGLKIKAHRRQSSLRKESLPFNPESDSTLIATAPGNGYASPPIGDIMFGAAQRTANFSSQQQQPWAGPSHSDGILQRQQAQFAPQRTQQYSPWHSPVPTPSSAGLDYMTPNTASSLSESALYDQASPYVPTVPSDTTSWGQEFAGQVGSGGFVSQSQGMEDVMGITEQEVLNNELQRIISNASHHSSQSYEPSRETSPFIPMSQPDQQHNPLQQNLGHTRHDSQSSRSASPFAHTQQFDMIQPQVSSPQINGNFPRVSSSSQVGTPYLNKPQSPPALIIPNQHSPSPVLPPFITTVHNPVSGVGSNNGVSLPRQGDLGGAVSGGLLPPANPALEGLTGMAGISPIAPNADGPMIYVQPSTPISGMKDGRGLFDAALRRAGAMSQQNQSQTGDHGDSHQVQALFSGPAGIDPLNRAGPSGNPTHAQMDFAAAMAFSASQGWGQTGAEGLRAAQMRPRAKSDSFMPSPTADSFDRQALFNLVGGVQSVDGSAIAATMGQDEGMAEQWRTTINAWRTTLDGGAEQNDQPSVGIDPRMLPGQEVTGQDAWQQFLLQEQRRRAQIDPTSQAHQLSQLQAMRSRLPQLNTSALGGQEHGQGGQGVFKFEPGEFSPTSMAFYQSMGLFPHSASDLQGTSSAPFHTTSFGDHSAAIHGVYPSTAAPGQAFLSPAQGQGHALGGGTRRRSFAGEGSTHPAAGAGTPGYGVEFTSTFNGLSGGLGQVRSVSGGGHRRSAKSEDFGRLGAGAGTGWGMGAGGSTADFLQSITANDGSLLPPTRGRTSSHSRHSSASSVRSASPALSISSQGSSFSHHSPRMEMPEGVQMPAATGRAAGRKSVAKMKVTSVATEMASTSRRTNTGAFKCPVPGCTSTFTRHFNLKGHLRSHNDERPYKCEYDGCPKAIVGFARQHDCKRHMLLHKGLRPFECEGCGKKFARLDALTRHHKSEQGQECAISHPLPVNPDGSPMSESQYKVYKGIAVGPGEGRRESNVKLEYMSGDDRSGDEDYGGGLSGMEDYDRF